jgi:thiamine monophosphate synthase
VVPSYPVLAIGGIDETNYPDVLAAGAGGFASIRFLNSTKNLQNLFTDAD